MIITQKKPMEELMAMVGDEDIAIVGCNSCATAVEHHTGGEPEAAALAKALSWEEACHFCGDCVLGQTGGICPVTQCAKPGQRHLRQPEERQVRSQPGK